MRLKRAITFVEILCCIVIMLIVAAISYPVFSSAKESAKITSAKQNLHQLFLAVALYRNDEDGAEFGLPAQMGLPSVDNVDSLNIATKSVPISSRWSPCGLLPGDTTNVIWYVNYRPFDEATWLDALKIVGNQTRMFYDNQCDFKGVDPNDNLDRHRSLAVTLDGNLLTKISTGSPDRPKFWGE